MKRKSIIIIACVLCVLLAVPVFAVTSDTGKLVGKHYNLNIIGVSNEKTGDITSGNRIFVPLYGTCKINLAETANPDYTQFNDNFLVLDGNGTDGTAAFQLPNPDPDGNGVTEYSVYARALGKPNGNSTMTTGAYYYDELGEAYIPIYSVISAEFSRSKGKQTFTNVTKELLYIYYDLDGDGRAERYNIFNDAFEDYFWQYDNDGVKLLQLRFYPIETEVPEYIYPA